MTILRRAAASLLLATAALLAWPVAVSAQPATPAPRDQIVLSGTVVVPRGEEVGEIVVFHGTVAVEGVARGDVVVLDGRITVSGQVSGSVVSLDGTVVLEPSAQVRGSVLAGNRAVIRPGAQVGGDVKEGVTFTLRGQLEALGAFVVWAAVSFSTLLLGFTLLLLAPRGADAVARAATAAPWVSAGVGLGAAAVLPAIAVILLVTLLGLPLGLTLLLALGLVFLTGYAWTAWIVGRLLWRAPRGRTLAFVFGWAIASALGAIPWVGGLTWVLGSLFGVGAAALATWRARGTGGRHRTGSRAAGFIAEQPMEEEGVGL